MLLRADLDKIQNFKEICFIPEADQSGSSVINTETGESSRLAPTTDVVIWLTAFVGISEITEDTVEEFYLRSRVHSKVYGPIRPRSKAPNIVALWIDRGDSEQFLVCSKDVIAAVHFARRYFVQSCGGQDDAEYWQDQVDKSFDYFLDESHGERFFCPADDVQFTLRGSELLGDRVEEDVITYDVVRKHIGLRTDAAALTTVEFQQKIFSRLKEDTLLEIAVEIEENQKGEAS